MKVIPLAAAALAILSMGFSMAPSPSPISNTTVDSSVLDDCDGQVGFWEETGDDPPIIYDIGTSGTFGDLGECDGCFITWKIDIEWQHNGQGSYKVNGTTIAQSVSFGERTIVESTEHVECNTTTRVRAWDSGTEPAQDSSEMEYECFICQ